MNSLILFLKGLFIGIGKIIPGVSGSLLAISLGVYEEALEKISHFFHHKKESFVFLTPLGIGILIAILFASKLMLHFLNTYYVYTIFVFLGLIVGTIPPLVQKEKMSYLDGLFIFFIVLGMFFFENQCSIVEFTPTHSVFSFLFIFFLGMIDAFTTVLPGISGTATFMMLGSYSFVLELFSNPFSHLFYCFLFGMGLLLGIILMTHVVTYCFKYYRHQTWVGILGFLFSSILSLLLKVIDLVNHTNLFSLLLLFFIGYSFIRMFTSE